MRETIRGDTLAVFYNGECPVCRPGIDHCRALSEEEGQLHRWIDIAADPSVVTRLAIPIETVRRRLHVIDRAGRVQSGIDAFIALWRELPRYRVLAALAEHPAAHATGAWLYDRLLEPPVATLNRWRALRRARPSVYERLLGERFRDLPAALQALHGVRGERTMTGRCFVERGTHPLARVIAALLHLPPDGREQPLALHLTARSRREIWDRLFASAPMRSVMREGKGSRRGLLVERMGALSFAFRVTVAAGTLRLDQVEAGLCGVRLPSWACGRVEAIETAETGRIRFEVVADLPLIGRLIRYGGWIDVDGSEAAE